MTKKPEPVADYKIIGPDGRELNHIKYYSSADMDAALALISELTADRDCWSDQCSQRVADWDEMRKKRDAALAEIERLTAQHIEMVHRCSQMDAGNVALVARIAALEAENAALREGRNVTVKDGR